jgi:hypothetical protein
MGRSPLFLEIPCVKQMRLDPMPTASLLETVVGEYLAPAPTGIYFRGRPDPVMVPGGKYHQHRIENGQQSEFAYFVSTIEELDKRLPVLDLDGALVVSPHQIPFLSYIPTLPTTALAIVETAVTDVIESHGVEEYRRKPQHRDDLYKKFINLDRVGQFPELLESAIDQIAAIVADLRDDVTKYCGDSRWVIHFLRKRHTELLIETSIDWRILEYHRLTGTELKPHDY